MATYAIYATARTHGLKVHSAEADAVRPSTADRERSATCTFRGWHRWQPYEGNVLQGAESTIALDSTQTLQSVSFPSRTQRPGPESTATLLTGLEPWRQPGIGIEPQDGRHVNDRARV